MKNMLHSSPSNNENMIPPEEKIKNNNNNLHTTIQDNSDNNNKTIHNKEAHKLANDLVLKAKALSRSVKKMPPSSPMDDAKRGFNLKHLNVLATRFAELAEISTALEDENITLKKKLNSLEENFEFVNDEKLDLERKVRTVESNLLPKMKLMRREVVELKRENVHMNESMEEILYQSDILTKRTKQGEIIVVKLQNVCKRLVDELNKTKLELMEAKAVAASPMLLAAAATSTSTAR